MIATSCYCSPLHAYDEVGVTEYNNATFVHHPNTLRHVVKKIYQLPEVQELLSKAQNDGRIGIDYWRGPQFQAYWDSYQRMILLNPNQNRTEGSCISSILFELHNATTNREFNRLRNLVTNGRIGKEEYVESVERLEHQNALSTCRILRKGIRQGIFPRNAAWSVYDNFDQHYHVQRICGHSAWIAKSYDQLAFSRRTTPRSRV
ncbi:MAG: hypothetical protein K940chlam7_01013 [Chlamydiae bacterium]|nr:hypothetical protein [Chlamydiota bacterium]